MAMTQHSPSTMSIPDYNPEELFAAKRVVLPSDISENDKSLSNTLFTNDKDGDLVSGLSPGYMTSAQEQRTADIIEG